jgi:hypothetical protein
LSTFSESNLFILEKSGIDFKMLVATGRRKVDK